MENNGLRFYQIFRFGGTIGVNSLSLGELLAINFATLMVMVVLIGVLASVIPIILLFAYGVLAMVGNWDQMQIDRIRANVISIIGYVYFMFDYHYGFIGWSFFNTFFGSEFVDTLCYLNTGLVLFNIFLLFYGNQLFVQINTMIGRFGVFLVLVLIGYKFLIPIGEKISPAIAKQYIPKPGEEIIKNGDDIVDKPYEGETLDDQIEAFERGRGNHNYEYEENQTTPNQEYKGLD